MTPDFSAGGFAERWQRYSEALAAAAKGWYTANGEWQIRSQPSSNRERLWGCCGLYHAGENELADAVIRQGDTVEYHGVKYSIFDTNIATALLAHHRDTMADDVRQKLERLARDGFCFKPGNRQPDYQFHGYNDNMPAKGTMGLILGGDLLGHEEAVDYGVWSLRQMRAMLVRGGINSEYNSPTYSALTLHAMAEIAHFAKREEARELALKIEQRLWIDLAARFHPEMGMLAGPHSRAYTADTIGHLSCVSGLLWFVMGDAVMPSPMALFEEGVDGLVLHHMMDIPFNVVQMAWYGSGTFHVPDEAKRLLSGKPYPFSAVAVAEHGDAGPDFGARRVRIESYLDRDFTLGTASTPFLGGEQTMSYFVTYRRSDEVSSYKDSATVFNAFVVDDEVPGMVASPSESVSNEGEADHLHSFSNIVTLQDGPTALVLSHPHLALGGQADTGEGAKSLSKLSELVIFPIHFGDVAEVLVDGEAREWGGEVPAGAWIVVRTGRLLVGICPLAFTVDLGRPVISLETHNNYRVIRTTVYDGEARSFSRGELRHIYTGFLAEHASVSEYASAKAYADELNDGQFTDYFFSTRRTRYRRPASKTRAALEMETSWGVGTYAPRVATINGKAVAWPEVAIDTIDAASLPFNDEPFTSVPSFFPWETFEVEWGPWPWAIGDREC